MMLTVDAAVHFQQIRVPVQVIKTLQQGEIQRGFHVGTMTRWARMAVRSTASCS